MATTIEDAAFHRYLTAKAEKANKPQETILAEMAQESFFSKLLALHEEYMAGQSSFGYMAEQLGISYFELTELLNMLGLPTTNS